MIRQLYNRLHKKFYYSTSFHRFIAPSTGNEKINSPKFSFYGKKLLSTLLKTRDVKILDQKAGKLGLQLGQIKCEITSLEELYILNEIFIDGCYNFSVPSNKIIVVDIGMNVGFASLFFAQFDSVKTIHSFEPFAPTFDQALNNFALNDQHIKAKITPHNFGLAADNKEEEWDYDYLRKGDTGLRNSFDTEASKFNITSKGKVKVVLKDATAVLDDILANRTTETLVIKIDCEGAEYEILEKLAARGWLSRIDVLMIEWHLKGPESISKLLLQYGFGILSQFPHNKVAGMIYAFNKSPR
ncbi:MAG: FkbM family methyltransferase [Chitinophagaceae bacterium]|nr:FkbM family methyltransferase [Chitinophagaceae bacterium]